MKVQTHWEGDEDSVEQVTEIVCECGYEGEAKGNRCPQCGATLDASLE